MPVERLSSPISTTDTMQQTPRPPLRRAVYIHVSDLTSAYNIDHKKLEQELGRVNSPATSSPGASTTHSNPTSDDASVVSMPQKRLQPPRGGFNLCVLVGKVNVVVDKLRVDRSRVRLAEVDVGDETGTVSLRARDDQIDLLEQVSGGAVVLRNCTLELFQGRHIRLAVTKWGKLNVFPDDVASTPPPPSKINRDRNFSLIDLSLVASEMVENQPPEQGGGYPTAPAAHRSSTSSNRQPFSSSPSFSQQRRNPRDRRQQQQQVRPPVNRGNQQMPVAFPEIPMPAMRYSAMPGYGFGDASMEPHYPYGAPRPNPDSMQPTAHHQLLHLQQQQYEMQHRQMQQMQAFHEQHQQQQQQQQGDRRGAPMLRQMQQNLGQGLLGTPSFDSGPPEFPSLPGVVPMHSGDTRSRNIASPREEAPESGPWGGKHSFDHGMDDAGTSPGRMNPQATAFAPSYGNPPMALGQQLQSSPYQQSYNPYDHQQRVVATSPYAPPQPQQHTIYTQNIVYVPVPGGHAQSAQDAQRRDDSHHHHQEDHTTSADKDS